MHGKRQLEKFVNGEQRGDGLTKPGSKMFHVSLVRSYIEGALTYTYVKWEEPFRSPQDEKEGRGRPKRTSKPHHNNAQKDC